MSKHNTFASFRDIDPSRYRNARESVDAAGKVARPGKKNVPDPVEDLNDEAALFLDAISGGIDVSLKNTPAEEKSSPKKKNRPPASGGLAAKPSSPPLPKGDGAFAEAFARNNQESDGISSYEISPRKITPHNISEDERLFHSAMNGVNPVRSKGRDLAPSSRPTPRVREMLPLGMDDIFSGALEFSLEYTEEFLQGHVVGLDPAVLGKLRAGSFSAEGHLDLHGQNLEQAYTALAAFIKHAYQGGKRHLLVITGRGKNSPGGTPILRERVQTWFTRDPFKRVVLAFCSAKPADGGAGALYLLLRKRKKNQGKIIWNRKPSEEDLLL